MSFSEVVKCNICQGQTYFCSDCCQKFDQLVPAHVKKQIAFGPEVEHEFNAMYEDLDRRVEEQTRQNRRNESRPGGSMTTKERRLTEQRVLEGMNLAVITQNIQKEKTEQAGLLVNRSPLDALPREAVVWLAGIDDETRHWLHSHQRAHEKYQKRIQSNPLDRDIKRQHDAIDLHHRFSAIDANLEVLPLRESDLGRPKAASRLPPTLHDVNARIEGRKLRYLAS